MKAHIWINTGSLRMFNFNRITPLENLTENRVVKTLRTGITQLLAQSIGLFPNELILMIVGEEIDSIDLNFENRYFVNELKEHLTYSEFVVPIRIFLSSDAHDDLSLSHKAYDCFVKPGGFDPAAAAIAHELSANPSYAPVEQATGQSFTFEFWIQQDGYWVDYDEYEEEPETGVVNIVWRDRS